MAKNEKYSFEIVEGVSVDAEKLTKQMIKNQTEWNILEQKKKVVKGEDQVCYGVLDVKYGLATAKAKTPKWFIEKKIKKVDGKEINTAKQNWKAYSEKIPAAARLEINNALNELLG